MINVAEAKKRNVILASEGAQQDQINRALGSFSYCATFIGF